MAGAAVLSVWGVALGFLTSTAAGCESDKSDWSGDCNCSPARTRTTILGEPTTNDGNYPSLEGAWLNVQSTEAAPYDSQAPAAVLEYFDAGDLVRVKFAVREQEIDDENGGAGGATRATP